MTDAHGAIASPLQWFGGPGQPAGPWEIPVKTFTSALDHLAQEADTLAIVGVSFGAEAALIAASLDRRVRAVVAFAPTHVVWAGYDEDHQRWTSHWTWQGRLLPFVPIRRPAAPPPEQGPPSDLPVYRASLQAAAEEVLDRAAIHVENIPQVLLVSGGDDHVWPAGDSAQAIITRRASCGLDTAHVHLLEAGHRTTLPGEQAATGGRALARGGTPEADATLGQLAWPHVRRTLQLR